MESVRNARIAAVVQRQLDDVLWDLADLIVGIADDDLPTNSRLNRTSRTLAWHVRRPDVPERMSELANELQRLQEKCNERGPKGKQEAELYSTLNQLIGYGKVDADWRRTALMELHSPGADLGRIERELDVVMAEETLRLVHLLVQSRSLQNDIHTNHGGAFPWQ